MPRRLVVIVAAALGVALVGGAAAAAVGAAGGPSSVPRTTRVTVAVWNDTALTRYEDSFAALEETDPTLDVEVTVLPRGARDAQLTTDLAAGTAPDVFWLDARGVRAHAGHGDLVDLDAALGAETRSAWSPELADRFSSDDTLWGVPQRAADVALVGNAGTEHPEAVARVLAWTGSVDGQRHLDSPAG